MKGEELEEKKGGNTLLKSEKVKPLIAQVGKATEAQIADWKQKYPDGIIELQIPDGEHNRFGYVKSLTDRNLFPVAIKFISEKNPVKAGQVILQNNWIGGDENLKLNDRLFNDACLKAAETLADNISAGTAKKL